MANRSGHPSGSSSVPMVTLVLAALAAPILLLGAFAALRPDGVAIAEDAGATAAAPGSSEFAPLEERSVVLAPDGRLLANLHGVHNRRSVPLDVVPDHVRQAVLTAEDRRFFEHDGYDLRAMTRAARANLGAGTIVQGGSTVSQQLAKSFVGDALTLRRKLDELHVARALEDRYSKEELLERYLNEVYFGAGAYGIAAAAEEFFGRDVTELSVDEAALLAGLIRAPSTMDPRRDLDGALERRDAVLEGMVEEGYLDRRDYAAVRVRRPEILPPRPNILAEPYVVAAVQRQFLADPRFGSSRAERAELLLTGGLQITTTIDVDLQGRATEMIRERFPGPGVTAAIAAVDPVTGAVRVLAHGRDFAEEQSNPALLGRRQPGSAFKTFVLAAALEEGYPLSTSLTGRNGTRFGTEGATGDWATRGVRNFGNASYGTVTAHEALVRSINTAFADLVMRVGADTVLELTDRLGISRDAYGGMENAGIALGGLHHGVSPLEMASAYAAFANLGIATRPSVIARVVDRHGEEIYGGDPRAVQAVDPDVNAAMVRVLSDAVTRGTGTRAQLPGWQVAGKTGTTQDNEDVWFAGTTPVLSAAAWVGNPDRRERLAGMSSSRTAAPLWRDFMTMALDGVEPVPFRDAALAPGPGPAGAPATASPG